MSVNINYRLGFRIYSYVHCGLCILPIYVLICVNLARPMRRMINAVSISRIRIVHLVYYVRSHFLPLGWPSGSTAEFFFTLHTTPFTRHSPLFPYLSCMEQEQLKYSLKWSMHLFVWAWVNPQPAAVNQRNARLQVMLSLWNL